MGHVFLSDEWFAAVDALNEGAPPAPEALRSLLLNFHVTGTAAGDADVHMLGGVLRPGKVDGAAATVTFPVDIAKKVLIDGDGSAAMQAMMSGKMQVDGDMTRLMTLQTAAADLEYMEHQKTIRELTD